MINMGVGGGQKITQNCLMQLSVIWKRSQDRRLFLQEQKNSIANFKLQRGYGKLDVKVTLRGEKMYEFADRLINLAFLVYVTSAVSAEMHLTEEEMYALGIKEQLIFPEIEYDKVDKVRGYGRNLCYHCQDRRKARNYCHSSICRLQK